MEVLRQGNGLLKVISQELVFPLTENDVEEIEAVKDFLLTEHNTAQGISAIQVGITKRFAIIKLGKKPFVIINPVVESTVGIQVSNESCLSTDKSSATRDYYKLKRPLRGVISYYDMSGIKHEIKANKHDIRVYCHEIDHMNGILITDKGKYYKSERNK